MINHNINIIFQESIENGMIEIINNVKLILYKDNPEIFDKLDFENDNIYLEPLLFAYINSKVCTEYCDFLWGFQLKDFRSKQVQMDTDEKGVLYLPNVGYFITAFPNSSVELSYRDKYILKKEGVYIDFRFEKLTKIHNKFEVLTRTNSLLNEYFFDEFGKSVYVEIESITNKHLLHLTAAFDYIQEFTPYFYILLQKTVKKVLIFNDPSEKRNSFATLSVHGCAFFNAYQEDYNEVFFIEDIAHQCGHIIFNTYLASSPDIFKIDENTEIFLNAPRDSHNEPRSLFVMIHAMYTYEAILNCFYGCLTSDCFSKERRHEMMGRLAYTLFKYQRDFCLLSVKDKNGENHYFNESGIFLLNQFQKTFEKVKSLYRPELYSFSLDNQTYNFSYKLFLKINPIKNE